MSIWTTLKSLVSIDPAYRVKAAPTSTEWFGPLGQRAADWSGIRDGERVRDVWSKCATAYACLSLLADAVAESPLRVYESVDGEPEERPDHPARTLLANPNPLMSEAEFTVLTVMTMGLFGYAATEKVRSGARLPVQLWPLRPDWLKYERTNSGARWVYRRPGMDPYPIADEDLIFTPYYHDPHQTSIGISPLHIVAREVGIDVALTDLLKVFIDAGGIPPWVVKITDVAADFENQAEADAFRAKWRQYYGGSQAYAQIGVLRPGMDLVKVGDSIGDMAWPDLRALTELKIAQAFRVPADLIQARDSMSSGSLTTTEMTGAMAFLQKHGAQPLRMRIDGSFTRALLRDFTGGDPRFSLEFDTSQIMALQEDRDALHNRVRADWQAGLITMNEARVETGRPDLGTPGDVLLQGFTTTYLPVRGLNGTGATERASATIRTRSEGYPALSAGKERFNGHRNTDTDYLVSGDADIGYQHRNYDRGISQVGTRARVYRDLKALSAGELETRASILQTTRRERDKLAEIGARKLRKFFKAQGSAIVRMLLGEVERAGPDAVFSRYFAEFAVRDVKQGGNINWDEEARRLWDEVFAKFYGTVGETAFASVAATVGVEIAWDLANPNIRRVLDELGRRIVDISETTRQDVIRVITDGQADGLNLQQIADNLTGMFEETYTNRAMTIARTETQVSYNRASQLGYQESGVVADVEMVDSDTHCEDYGASDGMTCCERNGAVINVGEMDRHIAAEHPNGSLAFIPILSKPLGEV